MTSPGHPSDLDTNADSQPVLADEDEVADHRDKYALHRHRKAGGEQAGERGERAQMCDEGEPQDQQDQEPGDDPAYQQQLISATRIGYVPEHCAAPELRAGEHCDEGPEQDGDPFPHDLQYVAVLPLDRRAPLGEVVAVLREQHRLLAEGEGNGGGLHEEPGERIEPVAQILERRAAGGVGRGGELIALRREAVQLLLGRRADLAERIQQSLSSLIDRLDGGDLL